jgi:hypothetical protein
MRIFSRLNTKDSSQLKAKNVQLPPISVGKKNSWDKNNTIMKTATKGLIRNSWVKDFL